MKRKGLVCISIEQRDLRAWLIITKLERNFTALRGVYWRNSLTRKERERERALVFSFPWWDIWREPLFHSIRWTTTQRRFDFIVGSATRRYTSSCINIITGGHPSGQLPLSLSLFLFLSLFRSSSSREKLPQPQPLIAKIIWPLTGVHRLLPFFFFRAARPSTLEHRPDQASTLITRNARLVVTDRR